MENVSLHEKIVSGLCRLCLSSDGTLIDMFSFSSELECQIVDAVTKCTSVHVEKYGELPSTICEPCYMQLIKTQHFQMQALKSDRTLHVYLQRLEDDSILGSSTVLPDSIGTSCMLNAGNQVKEDNNTNCAEIKPEVKNFEGGCDIDVEENKVFALESISHMEEVVQVSIFNPNLIVKAEPIINDNEDQYTEILNDFSASQKIIKSEKGASNDKKIPSYQCNVCNECFSDSDILRGHQRIHSGEKRYQCDICKKFFKCSNNLKDHKRVHTGEKPYQCNVCKNSFNKISNLRTHQRVHTGEKPYQCDVCKKCFSKSDNLIIHQRVHTGEKPHRCDVCVRSFRDVSHLRRHQRSHTGEKPFKCDVCNKCFTLMNDLKRHERIHTDEKPYQCGVCNKCFRIAGDLRTHQRVHTGEKPYQCDVCNNSFSKISNLKSHQRIHTGEKPYRCDVCNKCFTRLNGLNLHKTKHKSNVLSCHLPLIM